jgi:cytochrome b
MLLGLIAVFLLVLRVKWGVVGTRYARFGSFRFGPKALPGYLRGVFQRAGERHIRQR